MRTQNCMLTSFHLRRTYYILGHVRCARAPASRDTCPYLSKGREGMLTSRHPNTYGVQYGPDASRCLMLLLSLHDLCLSVCDRGLENYAVLRKGWYVAMRSGRPLCLVKIISIPGSPGRRTNGMKTREGRHTTYTTLRYLVDRLQYHTIPFHSIPSPICFLPHRVVHSVRSPPRSVHLTAHFTKPKTKGNTTSKAKLAC